MRTNGNWQGMKVRWHMHTHRLARPPAYSIQWHMQTHRLAYILAGWRRRMQRTRHSYSRGGWGKLGCGECQDACTPQRLQAHASAGQAVLYSKSRSKNMHMKKLRLLPCAINLNACTDAAINGTAQACRFNEDARLFAGALHMASRRRCSAASFPHS